MSKRGSVYTGNWAHWWPLCWRGIWGWWVGEEEARRGIITHLYNFSSSQPGLRSLFLSGFLCLVQLTAEALLFPAGAMAPILDSLWLGNLGHFFSLF